MRLPLVPLLVVLLAGCGDDDGPTLSDICNEDNGVFVDYYQKLFACFPIFDFFLGGAPTAADLARACDESIRPYLEDGTVTINGAVDVAACRAYIASINCNRLSDEETTPCDDLLTGTLEINEI